MRLPNRLLPPQDLSWPLVLILVAYVVLGVGYGVANPALESPDEADHFRYVRHLAEQQTLPLASNTERSEAHQPPLAYALLAAATGWLPAPDREALASRNPWWGYEQGSVGSDNKNQYVHTPKTSPGSSAAARGLLAGRLVNLLIGALGVMATYRLALWAFSGSHGLAAAATGFGSLFPQFVFIQASVNNDALLASLSSLTLLLLVWIARSGSTWRRAAIVGLAVALAMLTKLTALLLLPLVPIALVAAHGRLMSRRLLGDMVIVGVVVSLLSGWWFLRNLVLYGEPTGLAIMQQSWQTLRPTPLPPVELVSLLPNVERSFWGAFGWGNVPMPPWTYIALRALLILGVIGLIWTLGHRIARKPDSPELAANEGHPAARPHSTAVVWLLLSAWWLLNAAALLRVMQAESLKDMGRYLFPSAGAAACLIVLGLSRLLTPRVRPSLGLVLPSSIAALSAWALLFVLVPAYAPPTIVSDAIQVVPERQLDYRFGEEIALIGADISPTRITSGDKLAVTLYWQALRDIDRDYAVYIHVDPLAGGERAGQRDSYPGAGNWPTSNWRRGEVIVDRYEVPLTHAPSTPSVLSFRAGLFDPQTQERPRVTAGGRTLSDEPLVGEVAAPALTAPPPMATSVPATQGEFADQVRLQAFEVARDGGHERVEVTLYWQALRQIERAHTVFVHLVDSEGRLLAQHDGQPAGDAYPTTYWLPGETVPDTHSVSISRPALSGLSQIRVGLYETGTQRRLDRTGSTEAVPTPYFSIDLSPAP